MKKEISKLILGALTGLSLLSLVNCSDETSLVGSEGQSENVSLSRASARYVAVNTWDFCNYREKAPDVDMRWGYEPNAPIASPWWMEDDRDYAYVPRAYNVDNTTPLVLSKNLTPEESKALMVSDQIAYVYGVGSNVDQNDYVYQTIITYNDGTQDYLYTVSFRPEKISSVKDSPLNRYKITIPVNISKTPSKISFQIYSKNSYYFLGRISFESSINKLANSNTSFRIKNRWRGKYLHMENQTGFLEASDLGHPNWMSAQWNFEKTSDGYFKIKNRWKGGDKYIHIEDELDYVQLSTLGYSGWWSATWNVNNVQDEYYIQLQNRWRPDNYINYENQLAYAQSGNNANPGWWSSHWIIEVVE